MQTKNINVTYAEEYICNVCKPRIYMKHMQTKNIFLTYSDWGYTCNLCRPRI